MMDIKLTPQFILSIAAPLAGVIVAAASIAALLGPIRAIVGFRAALPIKIILTCNTATLGLPFGIACLRAKAPIGGMGLFDTKLLATLWTFQRNAILQIGASAPDFWSRNALSGTGNISTKTLLRTKAGLATFLTSDFLAALFTKHRGQFNYAKVVLGINGSATFTRAILAGPATIIPELFATLRAGFPSTTCL